MKTTRRGSPTLTYRIDSTKFYGWASDFAFGFVETVTLDSRLGSNADDLSFISTALSATMYPDVPISADISFITSTVASSFGSTFALDAPSLSLSAIATGLETVSVSVPFFTSTLSCAVTGAGNTDVAFGFISSVLTACGGANVAFAAPSFTVSSSVTGAELTSISATFPTPTLSATLTANSNINAAFGFIETSLSYWNCNIAAPMFTLSATGSDAVSNAVAYVMNVFSQESTRYTNFGFSHIVQIGGKPYGVKSDGLYLLEDATDAGTPIDGTITTKETDFGDFKAKMVPKIYLNTDTTTQITPYTDGIAGPIYQGNFNGRKTNLGRGLEARYWKFKISNIQQLEGLEFLTETKQRRVK